MKGSLRVAIDAQCKPSTGGGVAQAILGLVRALGELNDGPESYVVVVESQEELDWLKRFAGPNERFVVKPQSRRYSMVRSLYHAFGAHFVLHKLRPVRSAAERTYRILSGNAPARTPVSDGFFESLGCAVVHFPHTFFVLSQLRSVYNPHDLQHLHYPEFFTREEITRREKIYRDGCNYSHTVVAASQWIKDDIVSQYGIDHQKIQVIPWGPPTEAYEQPSKSYLRHVKDKYQLEQPFAFYPAVTWPHKNHIRLIEALSHLRDNNSLKVNVVCTSSVYEPFWPHLKKRIDELNISRQVRFLGYVSEKDLRAIYRLSQFLVMPSLFESDSFPVYEAWLDGLPVTCSNVTALPDQVMDAALLFDPLSVESIAEAIARLATDSKLREDLRNRGYQRVKDFDWRRTAKAYRAVYRRAAGFPLTEEDREILKWDWMRYPRRKLQVKQS